MQIILRSNKIFLKSQCMHFKNENYLIQQLVNFVYNVPDTPLMARV